MVYPIESPKITSNYGVIRNLFGTSKMHKGLDMISLTGNRVVKSVMNGKYRGAFYDAKGYGNYVVVEHDDGKRAIYAHLASFEYIPKNSRIEEGTILGIEGSTGSSTGIHLHFEVRDAPYFQRNHIDAAKYLGIKNEIGEVKKLEKEKKFGYTKEEAMEVVRECIGFEEQTMKYLDEYKYNFDLFAKIARAIKPIE